MFRHTNSIIAIAYRSFIASLCTIPYSQKEESCEVCGHVYSDKLVHFVCSCAKYNSVRDIYWSMLMDKFSVHFSTFLHTLSDWDFVCFILIKDNMDSSHIRRSRKPSCYHSQNMALSSCGK